MRLRASWSSLRTRYELHGLLTSRRLSHKRTACEGKPALTSQLTAAWILSSQRCAQPPACSLTLLLENRREAKGNSHHPGTDKDEKTNVFKILLVQPKSSCLSLLANLHVPFVLKLAPSVTV